MLLFFCHLAVIAAAATCNCSAMESSDYDTNVVQAVLDLVEGQTLVIRDDPHLCLDVIWEAAVQLEVIETLRATSAPLGRSPVAAHQEAKRCHICVDEIVSLLLPQGALLDSVAETLDACPCGVVRRMSSP